MVAPRRRTPSPSKRLPTTNMRASMPLPPKDYPPPAPSRALRRSQPCTIAAPKRQPPWPWHNRVRPLVALRTLSSLATPPPATGRYDAPAWDRLPPKCAGSTGSFKRCATHSTAHGSPKRELAKLLLLHCPFGVGVNEVQHGLVQGSHLAPSFKPAVDSSPLGDDSGSFGFGGGPAKPMPDFAPVYNLARVPPPRTGAADSNPCSSGPGPSHDLTAMLVRPAKASTPEARNGWKFLADNRAKPLSFAPRSNDTGSKRPREDGNERSTSPPKSPRNGSLIIPESVMIYERRLLALLPKFDGDDEDWSDSDLAMDVDATPDLSCSASPAPSPTPSPLNTPDAGSIRKIPAGSSPAHPIDVPCDERLPRHASLDETQKLMEDVVEDW